MAGAQRTRAELNEARLQVGVKMQHRSEQAAALQSRATELRALGAACESASERGSFYRSASTAALQSSQFREEAEAFAGELEAVEIELAAMDGDVLALFRPAKLDPTERLAQQRAAVGDTTSIEVAA